MGGLNEECVRGAVLFKRICLNDDERSVKGVAEMTALGLNLDRGIFKDSGRYGYGSHGYQCGLDN